LTYGILKQQWTIKISSPLFSIFSLVATLVGSRDHRTLFGRGLSADIATNEKYIIIGRIFESEIILIPPSLKISESSSNGSYRNTDEVWWRYRISRSCDEWTHGVRIGNLVGLNVGNWDIVINVWQRSQDQIPSWTLHYSEIKYVLLLQLFIISNFSYTCAYKKCVPIIKKNNWGKILTVDGTNIPHSKEIQNSIDLNNSGTTKRGKIVRFSAIQIQYETVINNQWKQWLLMDKIYIFAIQMLIS
jgi:hypothetical protein